MTLLGVGKCVLGDGRGVSKVLVVVRALLVRFGWSLGCF